MAGYIGSKTVSLSTTAANVEGNITVTGNVDGRDVSVDGTKLDGIETAATADQTDAEIRTAVESATDSNVFTDADHTKLNGIETAATADQTDAQIKTAVQNSSDIALAGNPTTTTQSPSNNSTRVATTAYTDAAITALVNSAPVTLDTLNELAAALDDDPNYAATTATLIGSKMPKSGGAFTGAVTTNSTFDGVDIAARDAVLTATTTTANAALPKAGGTMTGALNIETGDNLQIKDRGSVLLYNTNDDNYARIRNTTASGNELQFSTNAVAMTIDISGNVGIGTASPVALSGQTSLTINGTSVARLDLQGTGQLYANGTEIVLQGGYGKPVAIDAGTNQHISFRYATAEKMRITSSGNVGIGVVPVRKLHVGGTGSNQGELHLTNATTGHTQTDGSTFTTSGSDLLILQRENANIKISTNGTERMRIDSSGRVLIGTTTEGHEQTDNLTVSGSGHTGITIRSTDSNETAVFFSDGTSGSAEYRGYLVYRHDSDYMTFGVAGSEKMRIDSSGRVLIGTTTEGDGEADTLTIAETGNAGMTIRSGSSNSGNIFFSDATSGAGEYAGVIQYGHSGNYMRFSTSGTERLRIDSSGNVGIGIANPVLPSSWGRVLHLHSATANGSAIRISDVASGSGDDGLKIGNYAQNSYLNNTDSGFMRFDTNGAEGMRLDSSRNFLVGRTTSTGLNDAGHVFGEDGYVYHTRTGNIMWLNTLSSSAVAITFGASGTTKGNIVINTSSVSYNTTSDYRLKENVDYDWDATSRLKQLKPARFNFIADADTTVDGFLAHEAQAIVPEAVTGTKDEVDDDGVAVMQGIDQSKLVPLLVKTIQELEARITALEA